MSTDVYIDQAFDIGSPIGDSNNPIGQQSISPMHIDFGPFYATELDIPPELAERCEVPPDFEVFWATLRPAMLQVIASHPSRNRPGADGQPKPVRWPPDETELEFFKFYMLEGVPSAAGTPRWQLYDQRPQRAQAYCVWVLQTLFDRLTGAGFPV